MIIENVNNLINNKISKWFIFSCFILISNYFYLRLINNNDYYHAWFLIFLLCIIILGPIVIEILKNKFDVFNLKNIFLFYIFMQFVVWPITAYTGMYEYYSYYLFPVTIWNNRLGYFIKSEYYVILAVISFYIGYFYSFRKKITIRYFYNNKWNNQLLIFFSLLSIIVSFCSFYFLANTRGGIIEFILHIDEYRNTGLLGAGYLSSLIGLIHIFSIVLLINYFSESKYKKTTYFVFIISILLSLFSGLRHNAFASFIGLLIARNYLDKKIKLNIKLILIILLVLIINSAYILFRKYGVSTSETILYAQDWYNKILIFPRFIGAESFSRILDVINYNGFNGFFYILSDLIYGWIPRSIWAEKPLSSGLIANVLFFPEAFTGRETGAAVPTLIGELYWSAGLIGIIIGMTTIGILFKKAYLLTTVITKNNISIYILIYIFALYANESLSLHLFRFIYMYIILIILLKILNFNKRKI